MLHEPWVMRLLQAKVCASWVLACQALPQTLHDVFISPNPF
jgi:hypothetical protein